MKRFFQNHQRSQGVRASVLFINFFALTPIWTGPERGKTLHLGPLTMQACQPSIKPPPSGKWEVVPENIHYLCHRWLLGILQARGFFELEMQMHGGWYGRHGDFRSQTSRGGKQKCKSMNEQMTLLRPWKAEYNASIDGSNMYSHSFSEENLYVGCMSSSGSWRISCWVNHLWQRNSYNVKKDGPGYSIVIDMAGCMHNLRAVS